MKLKHYLLSILLFTSMISVYAQQGQAFSSTFNTRVKGDILQIGNNVVSIHPSASYNGNGANQSLTTVNVDIDGIASTFNSSAGTLQMPNTSRDCYRIRYAALYWAATYEGNDRSNINKIKFRTPGAATYQNVTGTVIYDEFVSNRLPGSKHTPYAAFADVTALINPVNAEGEYMIADIQTTVGDNNPGYSGGWNLFIVFEDPKLPAKFVTTFNGFTGISVGGTPEIIDVTGFQTIPAGIVRSKLAFAALEGDKSIPGDQLEIRGVNTNPSFTVFDPPTRNGNNIFDSSITDVSGNYINRRPASQNTLGYDACVDFVNGPANSVIGNNENSAQIRISTSGDVYDIFFVAFATDIIEPSIVLTKNVQNLAGQDIANQNVVLCQQLKYEIGFDNIGNDNAEGIDTQPAPYGNDYILIRDVLPVNVTLESIDLNGMNDIIVVPNPTNPRDLSFYVPKRYVTIAEGRKEFFIHVRVACSCAELTTACSNVVDNQAFITYQGVINDADITNDPSFSDFDPTCLLGTPNATNFLVGIDTCNHTTDVYICGNSVTLTAGANYDNYVWTGPSGAVFVPNNTSQTVTVNIPGTYVVNATDAQCRPIRQTFNVIQYGASLTNPIIPYDESPVPVTCADSGERIPSIYLCRADDSQLLQTNITNTTSVEWFLYDEATCGPYPATNCPVTTESCWIKPAEGTGSNFNVVKPGKYRVVFTFPGGCNRTFYFNVYQNLLNPQANVKNIICGNPGSITVTNVPTTGYEFQLVSSPTGTPVIFPWQSSPIFTPVPQGLYTVQIRPLAFSNSCTFSVPDLGVQDLNVTVTPLVTQPLCFGEKGELNLQVTGVPGQYYYTLYQGPTTASPIIGSVGPTNLSYHVFPNLTPGQTYTWQTRTDDGCVRTGTFTINNPTQLTISAVVTKPLTTCAGPGEITINGNGGTPPYFYYLNSAPPAPFLTSNVIPVATPGINTITVYDSNNCRATATVDVVNNPDPVYTINQTNVLCYGQNTGRIFFNVTNSYGYTLAYSIDGGTTFSNNPDFTNLPAGTYNTVLQYTIGTAPNTVTCTLTQTITITQPLEALTASGGVAAVACDSNGGRGIVRITNVQGGTPFPAPNLYQYNFGSGYQNSNQANLLPGTYTISVRDQNLCEYFMTVTLDPIPAPPTISVGTPVFNCNGTATSTVTVNNGTSNYTYTYSINPPLVPAHNPTSNVFQNVPCGNSVVTVNYTLVSPPTFSNLLNEDFGTGDDTTSPGINPNYCFERQINNPAIYCKGSPLINDGDYSVTKRIVFPYSVWYPYRDHTSNGTNINGRFLAINVGGVAGVGGIIYSKPITDIIPNQDIKVSLWAGNLIRVGSDAMFNAPNLTIQLVKDLGLPTQTIIASTDTGNIPRTDSWVNYNLSLNPGANTKLSFVVRSNITATTGNDVVIDDIEVKQLPVSCLTSRDFPINIPCNQAFTAQVTGHKDVSCFGASDATVTVAAQNFNATTGFYVSMNNGTTWTSFLSSPVTVPVPAVGYPGFVLVSYTAPPVAPGAACSFNLPQVITTPAQLVASASANNATCLTGATITASAVGGTPAYQYQLVQSPSNTVVVGYQTNNIFTNVAPGTYIVNVRDFNNCSSASAVVTIATPQAPDMVLAASDLCYDGNGASITVTTTGGNPGYEYNINAGSTWQTSNVFPNLTPGTYTIIVRDTYGCTDTLSVVIAPQLSITAALQKDLTCNPAPTNAIITGTVTGGTSPTITMNYVGAGTPPAFTGFPYNTPVAGTYTFTATFTTQAGSPCSITSNQVVVSTPVNPTGTATAQAVSCFGGNNGAVTITPSLGLAPYAITLNGTTVNSATAHTFTNLPQGTYTYTIVDAKGCPFSGSITVAQPTALSETHTLIGFTCNPTTNAYQAATLTVNGQNGTGPYQYSFNGGAFNGTNTFTINDNGTIQTINFIVRDANGCTIPGSVTVNPLNPPVIASVTTSTVTCLATTATATVNLTAGTGVAPLTYVLSGTASATNTNGVFSGLLPGPYAVTVTDANGCFATRAFTIAPVTPIAVAGVKISDVLCNGGNTGAVRFTVSGFAGTYSYNINAGTTFTGQTAGVINLSNQVAGTYTINVRDEITGCTATTAVTINEPSALTLTNLVATHVNCNNDVSQITFTVGGGTPNYTYAAVISGSPAPAVAAYSNTYPISVDTNLGANLSWDIYVKDANGCTTRGTITVIMDSTPSVTVSALATNQCTVSTGYTFTAVPGLGGVPPFTYSINGVAGPFQNSPTFTVNTPGTYTVTIKDFNGCTASSPAPVTIYPQLTANAILIKDIHCTPGNEAATLQVSFSGGSGGTYQYIVFQNGSSITPATLVPSNPFTVTVNNVANYTVQIIDTVTNCTVTTNVITTTTPVNPTVTTSQVNLNCFGDTNGSITFTASGGQAPYQYSINNGATFFPTNIFSGLGAGNYNYVVQDSKGCRRTGLITITSPNDIVVDYTVIPITCTAGGVSKGSIIINSVSGGVANYNYFVTGANGYNASEINTGGTASVTFNVVDFGLYEIRIVDANGCTKLIQNVLVASPPTDLDISINATADCTTGGQAVVTVNAAALGAGPFYFAVYTGPGQTYPNPPGTWLAENPVGSQSTIFNNLIPGVTYTFIVYDDNTKCYYFETATAPIPTNSTLTTTPAVAQNITCLGAADGNVSLSVSSTYAVPTSVTYEIFDFYTNLTTGMTGTGIVPANGSLNITNLGPLPVGTYYVLIRENAGSVNAGCGVVSTTFSITQSAIDLQLSASVIKNANCNSDGVITAMGSFGTGPYVYVISGSITPPAANDPSWNSGNTFSVIAGNYYVHVKDAYGCIKTSALLNVPFDAVPTINTIPQQCFVGAPLTFNVSGTSFNGNLVYGMNTANVVPTSFQTSNSFIVSSAGTYYFFVKDDNGCTAGTSLVVAPQLQLQATLTQDLTCLLNASVNLVATNGTSPYVSYGVSTTGSAGPFAAIAGSTYTTATAGSYYFQVTDTQGCTAVSNEIIVTPNTTPTFTYTQVNVSCNSGNDGSITITASNGIAPYQYSIDGGATWSNSNVFTTLTEAGVYNVMVRDAKNCPSASVLVDITDPDPVSGSITLTQGLTCGTANAPQAALVTVLGSGGTAPYYYSFDGGINYSTTNTYSTTASGTVTASIKDANGCSMALPIAIAVPALNPPTAMTFDPTPITCINTTSTVTITSVTNGVGTFNYEILSPIVVAPSTSNVFGGLSPSIPYLFQVTDANGCKYQEYYTISPVVNIAVTGQLLANVSCNGGNDGSVQFNVSNFTGTYSYTVNGNPVVGGQNSPSITLNGLTAATYVITITDSTTGCTAMASVEVTQPNPVGIVVDSNSNANCNDLAQVTVHGTGGTLPYTYAFMQNGVVPTLADFSNVAVGSLNPTANTQWDVYVRDANGCQTFVDVTITRDPLPVVTLPAFAADQCTATGNTYSFTAVGSSGIAPYSFSLDAVSFIPSATGSHTFTNLSPGTYTVTIKDANDCSNTASIVIYPPVNLGYTVDAVVSCNPGNDGQVTLTATGGSGVGNYTYTQTSPAGPSNTTGVFGGLTFNTYIFTVRDNVTGCTTTATVLLEEPTAVTLDAINVTDVSCNGGSDGSITVNLAAGNNNPPYSYALIAPSTVIRPAQAGNIFTNLPVGSYTVEVVSSRNCRVQRVVNIGEPNIIQPTVTATQFACNPGTNSVNVASIQVTGATGGSGNYINYEFLLGGTVLQSGTSNVYNTSNTAGGTYTINVYDDKNCVGTTTVGINPYISISIPTVTVNNVITCTTNEDITVSVLSTGGPAPTYTYTIVSIPAGYNATNTTGIFPGLPIGDYMITVTNPVTGCSSQTIHYVNDPNTFDIVASNMVNVQCINGNNGSVVLTFVDNELPDNAGAFDYTITNTTNPLVINGTSLNAGPTAPITGLTAGVYTVVATLRNAPSCSASTSFTISQPSQALSLSGTSTLITCNPGNDGTITVTANGGWLGYTYAIAPNAGTQVSPGAFTNLPPNNYTVTVTDALGCTATFGANLVAPSIPTGTVNNVQLACYGVHTDGDVTVINVTGGSNIASNYLYTLNYINPAGTSSAPQASASFNDLPPGDYSIVIYDKQVNCTSLPIPFSILPASRLIPTLALRPDSQNCVTGQAQLVISASGGNGTYQYSTTATGPWTTFTSPTTLPGLFAAGVAHQFYVQDTNGCAAVATNPYTIDTLLPLTLTAYADPTPLNCSYDRGTIYAKATGGEGGYVYNLTGPVNASNTTGTFTNLPPGNYTVEVVSGDCNRVTQAVTIDAPPAFAFDASMRPTLCSYSSDGSIIVTVTGVGGRVIQYNLTPDDPTKPPRLNEVIPNPAQPFTIAGLAPGWYTLGVYTSTGCFEDPKQVRIQVTSAAALTGTLSPVQNENCFDANDGAITITNIGGGGPIFDTNGNVIPNTYSITLNYTEDTSTPPKDISVYVPINNLAGANTHVFNNLGGGMYKVRLKDANGCYIAYNVTIKDGVNYSPDKKVEFECQPAGQDNNTLGVTVTVLNTLNNGTFSPLSDYTFALGANPPQTSPVFTSAAYPELLNPGTHTISINSVNTTCDKTVTFDILATDVDPLVLSSFAMHPTIVNTVVANISNPDGTLSGTAPYTFEFQNNGSYTQSGSSSTYVYSQTGDVTVTVTDANGCQVSATLPVTYVPICIPDVLTPDSDGFNDTWLPGCVDPSVYPRLVTRIYDRYGRLVATIPVTAKDGWDGTYEGKALPSGDYWYVVKVNGEDGQQIVGHFTLYR